jgi:hypothetical protein
MHITDLNRRAEAFHQLTEERPAYCWAAIHEGSAVAVFKDQHAAKNWVYWYNEMGAEPPAYVLPWAVPQETFEFDGN